MTATTDPFAEAQSPGQAASPTAMKLLEVLHANPAGLRFAELASLADLPHDDVRAGLHGLRERNRIVCSGRSTAALWFTRPHFKAQNP